MATTNPKQGAPQRAVKKPATRAKALQPDAGKLIRTALQAYVRKDRAAIESVLADNYHFTSPLDNRLDRATYFEICWPGSKGFESVKVIHVVVDGNKAFITYEAVVGGNRLRKTERHTARGGKVVESEVYFGWSVPHDVPLEKHNDETLDDRISA
jgi:hypothetical protein